ncbi:PAS domain S-box protein [Limnoraphis robusta CCNP1315]|uniref:histidine kinase n=1 Tax=Limnoraphis robusta CCNP1315 TaxID=3110306 RepID=A0ABU5U546_9CYAN|nr:PAS domain S-box protein [Limnoraphis robusta]MEA5522012.1 PAS domain S-box protein [Limnoraphis robusta CCNP1315]
MFSSPSLWSPVLNVKPPVWIGGILSLVFIIFLEVFELTGEPYSEKFLGLMAAIALIASWGGLKTALLSITFLFAYIAYLTFICATSISLIQAGSSLVIIGGMAILLGGQTDQFLIQIEQLQTIQTELEQQLALYVQALQNANQRVLQDLNERQLTQEQLQMAQARLQHLIISSPIVIYSSPASGHEGATFISDNVQSVLGYKSQEFADTGFWAQHIHPEDAPRIFAELPRVFEQGQHRYEYRFLHGDGTYHWIQDELRLVTDQRGKLLEIVGYWIDINDRKQVEAALRDSEFRYRTLAQRLHSITSNAPIYIYELDSKGRILFANRTAQGMTQEQVLGELFIDLFPCKNQLTISAIIEQVFTKQQVQSLEYVMTNPNGEIRVYTAQIAPIWVNNIFTTVVLIATDITERKQAEQTLQRHALIFEQIYDGVIMTDLTGRIIDWNPGAERMFGYCKTEVIGQTSALVHYPEGTPIPTQSMLKQIEQQGYWLSEMTFIRQDKTQGICDTIVVPIFDHQGQMVAVIGVYHDISDRKQAEVELQQYRDHLEQLVEQRTSQLEKTNAKLQREIEARAILAEELLASEARLAGILDNANDAIISVNEDQQVILFNKGAEKIFGYQAEEVLDKPLDILLPQRFLSVYRQHIQEFDWKYQTTHNSGERLEVYGRRQDGSEFPTEASISQLLLGNTKTYTAILRDISERVAAMKERQQAETALRESERRYATLTEVSPVGIFRRDAAGNCLYVNERWCQIAGLSPEEALGQGWIKALHPDDRDGVFQAWEQAVRDHCSFQLEYRFQRADGSITWVFGQAVAETDIHSSIKGFVGSITDINDRKQAEATLQESERRWRSLLENVRLAVVGLNEQGTIDYVNPFFLELTGYTQGEILGQDWFITFLPASQRTQVREFFNEILDHQLHTYYQNTIITKSGEEKIIAWNNTRLQSLQGEALGTMSIGEDITERYAIERMKNEFISVVSHELRTPLTAIHGALNLLSTGLVAPESPRGQQVIKIAAESTERLVRLVNDILELERLECGKIRLVKHRVNAADLLRVAQDQMQVMANRVGIILEIFPQDIEFEADGDRMIQVLTNLISNAIKFSMSEATIQLSVEAEFREFVSNIPTASVLFSVRDQGRGIPLDQMESIFERFHQIDASDSRQKGGTGLGLAICRSIVEQHGGKIWVESILDQGSCFYFSIPVKIEEKSDE